MPVDGDRKETKKPWTKTKSAPQKECSDQEYEELLSIAKSLTEEDARAELIDCARYGELDAVRALLEVWSPKVNSFIDSVDENGSSALHKSSASGHEQTVQLLLFNQAKFFANTSGRNNPLHWAAANGNENVVEMLLRHEFQEQIDVLQKNDGGRSALTEGFSSNNTKIVGMILEHDSAAEDKLISGGKEIDASDADMEDVSEAVDGASTTSGQSSTTTNGITHEFDFLRDGSKDAEQNADKDNDEDISDMPPSSILEKMTIENEAKTVLIRELPIKNADNPFGDSAIDDTTGLGIWSASLVMARWMASKSELGRFDNKTVLELGAGCAVPSIALALHSKPKAVYITDFNPATIRNIQHNISINAAKASYDDWDQRVKASSIDWGDETTWPKEQIDFVIGSDLIYQKSIVPLLKKVVSGLIKDEGSFLYACPSDGRDGLAEFIETMKKEGFKCVSEEVAPDLYRSNPLSNGDSSEAFLHFYELPVTEYKLYEFKKRL
jgi:predicted nicotinamide N-methyase